MFVKEGWSSPYSFLRRLYERELKNSADTSVAHRQAEIALSHLMEGAKYGCVLLSSGATVTVDDAFLSRVERRSPFEHAYFNLKTSEVGTVAVNFPSHVVGALRLLFTNIFSKRFLRMNAVILLAMISFIVVFAISITAWPDWNTFITPAVYWLDEMREPIILLVASVYFSCMLVIFLYFVLYDIWRIYHAWRSCKAYAGGHLILSDQVYEEFVRGYYSSSERSGKAGGRPRHPAYEWYKQRGFDRQGLTPKEIQQQMPTDANGNPPSETTIRDWERAFLQQKPPTET